MPPVLTSLVANTNSQRHSQTASLPDCVLFQFSKIIKLYEEIANFQDFLSSMKRLPELKTDSHSSANATTWRDSLTSESGLKTQMSVSSLKAKVLEEIVLPLCRG